MEKYQRIDFRDQIARNKTKSFFLIVIVFVIFVLFGYVISMAFDPGYFFFIMTIASVGARKANRSEYRDYYSLVEGLTLASGLPMPELYIMPMKQINAFASGRNPQHAVVCV